MPRSVTTSSAPAGLRKPTLRSRLLVRLACLLLILLFLGLVVLAGQRESVTAGARVLLTVLLLAGGMVLLYSVLSLVQRNLLDPLSSIRPWARNIREGIYTDPIPTPRYGAFAELADDLNSLGKKLQSFRKTRLGDNSDGQDADAEIPANPL